MKPPTADELERYDKIFGQLKDQSTGTLSGAVARDRWASFALPPDTLLKVWSLSDQHRRGALDMYEHRIAMHLIGMARTNVQLPTTVPPMLLAAAMPSSEQQIPAQPLQLQAPVVPPSQALPVVSTAPPVVSTATQPTADLVSSSEKGVWSLNPEDVTLYKQMFASADSAKLGKVTTATSQLSRSGLPAASLMQIWRMADVGSDDQLDLHTRARHHPKC